MIKVGMLVSRAADAPPAAIAVGTRVRIERDETRYPSRGTWGQFRGKTGTVVEVNRDRKRPHLTEYGVSFGKVRSEPSSSGSISNGHDTVWFKAHELTPVTGSGSATSTRNTASQIDDTSAALAHV
jgi:hypothetical protein